MNKIKYLLIIIGLFVLTPMYVKADDKYYLKSLKSDKSITEIGTYDTYALALENMNKYPSSESDIAAIYHNDKIINASYAIGNIGGRGIIYMYQNAKDKEQGKRYYTYIESNWGSDVAFIDYYDGSTPMVKIAISGIVGWTQLSNIDIIPVNSANLKVTISGGINIRKEPSTTSEKIGVASNGSTQVYYETKINEGYTWYKIQSGSGYGWIAAKENWVEKISADCSTYYISQSNVIKHVYRSSKFGSAKLSLGPAPTYLENNKKYYSFDGIYFYDNLITMLGDYKKGTFEHSINYTTPYYNYYLYLPSHSITGYTKEDFDNIIINLGYTKAPDPNIVYVDNNGSWMSGVDRTGVSALYNQGASFINFQNNYGLNAFSVFSNSINESGRGTNNYALGKNNVLSIGVCDSCKYANTRTFDSVYDNLITYASLVNGSYSNPSNALYYGSHAGNKGSGMNVNYASDPYWGEKQAQIYYTRDRDFGGSDYNSNILGIKQSMEAVNIYKDPYESSSVIYTLKNSNRNQLVPNIPLIVAGEVTTVENGKETKWYKVYTDVALDENQNKTSDRYEFSKSYGFVKAEKIYISNATEVNELNEDGYKDVDGLFHLEKMVFENDKLTFTGFEIVYGVNNIASNNPKYKITFVNQNTNEEYIKTLNSTKPIFDAPKLDEYDYSGSWFTGELDLSDIPTGDYTMYVTAMVNGYQTTSLVSNKLFNKNVTSKYTATNGRGYQLKSNFYDSNMPLELFIRDGGLLSDVITPTEDNMFNQYYSVKLNDGYLNLVGTSHNVGGNYSKTSNIDRDIVITNSKTMENKIRVKAELLEDKPYSVSLRVSDNLDKTNAWYKSKIDISNLENGVYIIYVKTKVKEVDDYGEVNDILFTDINESMVFNNKKYSVVRNDKKRFRLELIVEDAN